MDRRLIWIGLGFLTLVLRWIFSFNPQFVEVVYSRSLFVVLRYCWDYTLGFLPFPLLYPVVGILGVVGIRAILNRRKTRKTRNWRNRMGATLLDVTALAGAILFLFNFLWGFNYQRVPIETQLSMKIVESPTLEALLTEADISTRELVEAYQQLDRDTTRALSMDYFPELESNIRQLESDILRSLAYPAAGRVRCRRILPGGTLLQLGATGIYIPFINEGQIDGALVPTNRVFTYAHEMAHANGFGDEGTANFIAYLTCESAENPAIRYAGRLDYWFDVMGQLRQVAPEAYEAYRSRLPAGMEADILAIRAVYEQYPGFFPQMSRWIYDRFLKGQGVEEGIRSYSRVVNLVMAWRKRGAA